LIPNETHTGKSLRPGNGDRQKPSFIVKSRHFIETATHSQNPSPPSCAAPALPSDPWHLSSGKRTSPIVQSGTKRQHI